MTAFKIPVVNTAQVFNIALAGVSYTITCKWNDSVNAGWVMDFSNALTGVPIVTNVPLVTGTNCFDGLDYLGFGGILFIYTDGSQFSVPTFTNLGVESNVYFDTDVAIA